MNRKEKKLNRQMDKILKQDSIAKPRKSKGNRAIRKFASNKLAIIGLFLFGLIIILCFCAPLFTTFKPEVMDLRNMLKAPSSEHIFGTDSIGRDLFSRVLYGGRMSISIGFGSAIGASILGVALGAYSGYKGGIIDSITCRISELLSFFPQTVLCLLLVTMVGQSVLNLMLVFTFTGWCSIYRMTRSQVLSLREEEYVQAMKVQGLPTALICFKHIIPNALGPVVVSISISTANFILEEAALSFLGLGVPMQTPTWGNILNVANDITILQSNWWVWLPVGCFISLFVLSINFIGDGLRDSTDPSQQG